MTSTNTKQVFVIGIALVTFFTVCPALAAIYSFTAYLSGDNEVPPVATAATGVATIVFDTDVGLTDVAWTLTFSGLESTQTAAGFYDGFAGEIGNPIPWRTLPLGSPQNGSMIVDMPHWSLFVNGIYNPEDDIGIFANVHTAGYPGGEIRGQFRLTDPTEQQSSSWGEIKALFR